MAKIKTAKTDQDVTAFIESLPDEQKRADSFQLVNIMSTITGQKPYMYGPTIIGFGNYHYTYDSGHEGDAPVAGFSPRKAAISLYLANFPERAALLEKFGKHRAAVSCIYFKKLADIEQGVLKQLIKTSMEWTQRRYPPNK